MTKSQKPNTKSFKDMTLEEKADALAKATARGLNKALKMVDDPHDLDLMSKKEIEALKRKYDQKEM